MSSVESAARLQNFWLTGDGSTEHNPAPETSNRWVPTCLGRRGCRLCFVIPQGPQVAAAVPPTCPTPHNRRGPCRRHELQGLVLFLLWSLADMEGIVQRTIIHEDCLRAVGRAVRARHLAPAIADSNHWLVSPAAAIALCFLPHMHAVTHELGCPATELVMPGGFPPIPLHRRWSCRFLALRAARGTLTAYSSWPAWRMCIT